MGDVARLLRAVTFGDWVIEGVIPSLILGWSVWGGNPFGLWLGVCGILYFVLRAVVYPIRGRTHAEYGRLLPGVAALCGCGFFAGLSWWLIVFDSATGAVVLGLLLGACALPVAFAAAVFLSTTLARRVGMAPEEPVVEIEPNKWPDPPSYGGGWL